MVCSSRHLWLTIHLRKEEINQYRFILPGFVVPSSAMKVSTEELLHILEGFAGESIALRHELHRHPEIALGETQTRSRLLTWLDQRGVLSRARISDSLIGTDLVFELPGEIDQTVGLRADMDGLPVDEQTGCRYVSQVPGMMHACGHDGHMAILALTALLVSRIDPRLRPTVRFIFQPGEEEVCAGADLVAAGVCDGLDRVYALHGWPGLPAGSIGIKEGVLTAAAHTFDIILEGRSCHGATPSEGLNPLPAAADMVLRLNELHRDMQLRHRAVVSPCGIQGGASTNVIPQSVRIRGTVRTTKEHVGDEIRSAVHRTLDEVDQRWGTVSTITYHQRYRLPVRNHPRESARAAAAAEAAVGKDRLVMLESHSMVAEDFAFYLDRVPGYMLLLGLGEDHPGLHSSSFDFDDRQIIPGALVLSLLI